MDNETVGKALENISKPRIYLMLLPNNNSELNCSYNSEQRVIVIILIGTDFFSTHEVGFTLLVFVNICVDHYRKARKFWKV